MKINQPNYRSLILLHCIILYMIFIECLIRNNNGNAYYKNFVF